MSYAVSYLFFPVNANVFEKRELIINGYVCDRSVNELTGLVLTCSPTDTRCLPTGDALLELLSLDISETVAIGALFAVTVVVAIIASLIFDRTTRPPWANAVAVVREEDIMGAVRDGEKPRHPRRGPPPPHLRVANPHQLQQRTSSLPVTTPNNSAARRVPSYAAVNGQYGMTGRMY